MKKTLILLLTLILSLSMVFVSCENTPNGGKLPNKTENTGKDDKPGDTGNPGKEDEPGKTEVKFDDNLIYSVIDKNSEIVNLIPKELLNARKDNLKVSPEVNLTLTSSEGSSFVLYETDAESGKEANKYRSITVVGNGSNGEADSISETEKEGSSPFEITYILEDGTEGKVDFKNPECALLDDLSSVIFSLFSPETSDEENPNSDSMKINVESLLKLFEKSLNITGNFKLNIENRTSLSVEFKDVVISSNLETSELSLEGSFETYTGEEKTYSFDGRIGVQLSDNFSITVTKVFDESHKDILSSSTKITGSVVISLNIKDTEKDNSFRYTCTLVFGPYESKVVYQKGTEISGFIGLSNEIELSFDGLYVKGEVGIGLNYSTKKISANIDLVEKINGEEFIDVKASLKDCDIENKEPKDTLKDLEIEKIVIGGNEYSADVVKDYFESKIQKTNPDVSDKKNDGVL